MIDSKLSHKFSLWELGKKFFLVSLAISPTTLPIFNNLKLIVLKKITETLQGPFQEEYEFEKKSCPKMMILKVWKNSHE